MPGFDSWQIVLKRVYVLKNLGVRHLQRKNYKIIKKHKGYKSNSQTKVLGFFKTLVTQNHNPAFNNGFYLR